VKHCLGSAAYRAVALASSLLKLETVNDLNATAMVSDKAGLLELARNHVTVVLRTANISEMKSCVSGRQLSVRSQACSNHRAKRSSRLCSALQAAVCCTCASSDFLYRSMRLRIGALADGRRAVNHRDDGHNSR
jgi:hypothetical protein